MQADECLDYLIIGTGPAGLAAGMALRRNHKTFEVLDVGYDIEDNIAKDVSELAASDPTDWDKKLAGDLYPPPIATASGVERRNLFGSDFVYRKPDCFEPKTEECTTEFAHGLGGFGNVWGAAAIPYPDEELQKWPVDLEQFKASYKNVFDYVPLSAEDDGLANSFPLHTQNYAKLPRNGQTNKLLHAFEQRRARLEQSGVEFGRARLAVSGHGAGACRRCGHCLEGCPYGSIFNPRLVWKQLQQEGVKIHTGQYVLEFEEFDDHVQVASMDLASGTRRFWKAKRIFLAAGHIASARMIARSMGLFDRKIIIRDSQYFFFPLLSWGAVKESTEFTLAEMFAEGLDPSITKHHVHFQMYGANEIFRKTLEALVPRPLPIGPLINRLYLMQGFLHSQDSGHLEMEVKNVGPDKDAIVLRGVENDAAKKVARKWQSRFRNWFKGFGIIPPVYLKMTPVGRSFHAGASFPMGGSHKHFSSDSLGRPAGLHRVHIADSACFPQIAGSTIAITIMANADRIVQSVTSSNMD